MPEKMVVCEGRVEHLYGLLVELKRAFFSVKNVAADKNGTYVYLDEAEEKDPTPIVTSFVGRKAPRRNSIVREERVDEMKALEDEIVRRREEERLTLQTAADSPGVSIEIMEEEPVGFWKRLFRKIF